jgi:uncharacterized protein (DUF486 family)
MSKKKAVVRSDMTRAQWTWKEMKRNKVAYMMVAPYMLIFTLFTVVFFRGEALQWNHFVAFGCLIAAVFFVFLK